MSGLVTDFTEATAQNKQSKYLITIHECSEQSLIGKKRLFIFAADIYQ